MSFRQKYLTYLRGNRHNIECELISDNSSSSSGSTGSWDDSSSSEEEMTEPVGQWQSRGGSHHPRNVFRPSKERPNGYLGLIVIAKENPSGSARTEKFASRKRYDRFAWLSSPHREFPTLSQTAEESLSSITRGADDVATKYKNLKQTANAHLGVYRSKIHGRGLFSLVNIDPGEMVVEFIGEVVRSGVLDVREKHYKAKGIESFFFRIDGDFAIDGTVKGNIARFINHSCEPNCYSEVFIINGKRHLIIMARIAISFSDEITCEYNYWAEERIKCTCDSSLCREFLN